ncbi:Plasmodium vivax Vir protein, putative [Plasmodium vivax]|uniref:Vir protein, putative n=1 Tax=Plasmodium vivax TaxID=5855 RepID=A0A1G4E584_PLAVI|nr:Plasmodium vivax Vir protein, putative [Plasmodium vivax]
MLFDVLNVAYNIIICKPFSYAIDRDTFYKNKLLFDYSQDHEHIKIHTAGDQYDELSSFHCVLSENSRATLEQPSVFGTHEPAQNEHYKVTTEVRDSVGHRSTAVDFNLESNPSSVFSQDLEKIQPVPIGDTAEGGSSKTIAGLIAPVLGVSSFSLLLYKVTPVGGFINRLLGRNRNMYNPVEYMDSFNPYSDGMDPGIEE